MKLTSIRDTIANYLSGLNQAPLILLALLIGWFIMWLLLHLLGTTQHDGRSPRNRSWMKAKKKPRRRD